MSTDGPSTADRLERAARVDAVIDDVIARRLGAAPERDGAPDAAPTDGAITAAHPHLMPEPGQKPAQLHRIQQAARAARFELAIFSDGA